MRGTTLVESGEGSPDEQWRPAGEVAIQVESQSATGQEGGEKRVKREIEAVSMGESLGGNIR